MIFLFTGRSLLRNIYSVFARLLGILFFVYIRLLHYTCRIHFKGAELPYNQNYILCIWHESFPACLAALNNLEKHAWMVNPARRVKHIEVMLKQMGLKHICYGTSGNNGTIALAKVTNYLRNGYLTVIAGDGPSGPLHKLKRGALLMSQNAAVPVIPLRFNYSCYVASPQWDKKRIPLPFSNITVEVGHPVYVREDNFKASAFGISNYLNFV